MRSVVVSEDAESELELVYDYLSVFGEQTAEKFLSSAYEKCIGMLEDGVVEFPCRDTRSSVLPGTTSSSSTATSYSTA